MEVFDHSNVRSLASVILWQYDNAVNLQKLIWRTVRELSEDGTVVNVQHGLLQRMMDFASSHFEDFYRYVFSALLTAEEFENTMETENDISDMTPVGKLFFGLTVWSRLTGLTRPQYVNSGTTYNVPLLSWARYMRAEIQKVFTNGTCFEINRYMRVLLPHYNVYVVDNGSTQSTSYMTQSFKYRPDFVYTGYVTYKAASSSYVISFAIDTTVNAQGSAANRFVQTVQEVGAMVAKRAVWCQDITTPGAQRVLLVEGENSTTHVPNGIFTGGNFSWSMNANDGLYKLTVSNGTPIVPSKYENADGEEQKGKSGAPQNILAGAPNIGEMMKLQYVDEYLLIKADEKTISSGGMTLHVSGLFPHPAGVLSSVSQSVLKFGNISEFIGLNDTQASGQNAAVLDHGILYSN